MYEYTKLLKIENKVYFPILGDNRESKREEILKENLFVCDFKWQIPGGGEGAGGPDSPPLPFLQN